MITTPTSIFYKLVHTNEKHHTAENIAKGINDIIQETETSAFEYLNHVLQARPALYSILTEDIKINDDIKATILD
ncbi:1809_t:CDS:2, partial [Racocetra fulgida]